jgi:hypothetical protein
MTELPLAYKEQIHPPKRPGLYDERVIRRAAEQVLPEVIEWLEDDYKEQDKDIILSDLTKAFKRAYSGEGYEVTKALDRLGWSCDAQLVEICNGSALYIARDEIVKEWVEANKIKPKLRLYDRVIVKPRGEQTVGIIERIYLDRAEYVIKSKGKNFSYVYPYESVKKWLK